MIEIVLCGFQNWAPRFYASFSVHGEILTAVSDNGEAYSFNLDSVESVRVVPVAEYKKEKSVPHV